MTLHILYGTRETKERNSSRARDMRSELKNMRCAIRPSRGLSI